MFYVRVNCPTCGTSCARGAGAGSHRVWCDTCRARFNVEVKPRKAARMAHSRTGYADATGTPNDCAVRSISAALGLPYETIDAELRALNGRDKDGSTWTWASDAVLKDHGAVRMPDEQAPLTLRAFAERYPVGVFVVGVHRHVCLIWDGVLLDWSNRPMRRVLRAWRTDVEGCK